MPEDDLVRFRDPEIAALAKSMTARLPELADQLAERIRQAVDVYGAGVVVPLDDLRTSCKNHLEFLLGQLTLPGARGHAVAPDAGGESDLADHLGEPVQGGFGVLPLRQRHWGKQLHGTTIVALARSWLGRGNEAPPLRRGQSVPARAVRRGAAGEVQHEADDEQDDPEP